VCARRFPVRALLRPGCTPPFGRPPPLKLNPIPRQQILPHEQRPGNDRLLRLHPPPGQRRPSPFRSAEAALVRVSDVIASCTFSSCAPSLPYGAAPPTRRSFLLRTYVAYSTVRGGAIPPPDPVFPLPILRPSSPDARQTPRMESHRPASKETAMMALISHV